MYFNSHTGNARGVATMLNNNFEYKVHNIRKNNLGNYIIVDITIEGERMTLANIYGPNTDNDIFYQTIFDSIEEFQNEKYILWRYFNLVINQDLDTKNYKHVKIQNAGVKY